MRKHKAKSLNQQAAGAAASILSAVIVALAAYCSMALIAPNSAQAQYSRATAQPQPQQGKPQPPSPAAGPNSPAAPAAVPGGQVDASGGVSPLCFEPMDGRNAPLANTLRRYSLLCPTAQRTGDPVRLVVTAGGELTADSVGPPTAWHRVRK